MDISIKPSHLNESTLIWAIICSILLHALLAITLPNIKFDTAKKPPVLEIELQQPKPAEPVAAVLPEPTPIEPIQPEIVKPRPDRVKPLPKKERTPEPIEQASQPTQAEPTPPAVITAAPKADAPPTIVVPEPAPPKKIEPNEDDVNAALNLYGSALGRAIAKFKQYPKIAQMRGWQGECLLDLKIDSNGNVLFSAIKQSSGFDALDKQALEMVRKASPFPAPPDALRGRNFNITVPVSFKLE